MDAAIEKANALNKDDYKDFSKVEAAVNAVVRDKDSTEQAEVDAMAAAIEAAIAGLEKRTETPDPGTQEPETHDYKVIEGANGTWAQNSDGTLTFRANGDFSKFKGIKINGTPVDASHYTAVSGSTVVTLKADYLKTLPAGTYTLTFVYEDGECSTDFEVKKVASEQTKPTEEGKTNTTSPQTGDNSNPALWFALLIVSGAGALGAVVYIKKKNRIRG